MEVVTTERLLLRPFALADLDLLAELDGDPDVRRFLADGRPVPRTVVEHVTLPGMLETYRRQPGFGCRAVFAGAEFQGWVELLPEDGAGEASIGWRFLPRAWGHGYATEAARALLDLAFGLGVRRVTATTMSVNSASRRVMERIGMRFVRTFFADWPVHIPGAEHGDVEYERFLTGPGTSRSARPTG